MISNSVQKFVQCLPACLNEVLINVFHHSFHYKLFWQWWNNQSRVCFFKFFFQPKEILITSPNFKFTGVKFPRRCLSNNPVSNKSFNCTNMAFRFINSNEKECALNLIFILYWNIVYLQYCISFRYTAKWFSYICILFLVLFHYRLLQDTEYSSLCYTVGPCWLSILYIVAAAAAAKSLQSCPTLCDPIDSSPPDSAVPGILQARTLEWAAISFSSAWK